MSSNAQYYPPVTYQQRKSFGVLRFPNTQYHYRVDKSAGVWGKPPLSKNNRGCQQLGSGPANQSGAGYVRNRGQISAAKYRNAQQRIHTQEEIQFIQRMPVGAKVPTVVGSQQDERTDWQGALHEDPLEKELRRTAKEVFGMVTPSSGIQQGTQATPVGVSMGTQTTPVGVSMETQATPVGVSMGTQATPVGVSMETQATPVGVSMGTQVSPPSVQMVTPSSGIQQGTQTASVGVSMGTQVSPQSPQDVTMVQESSTQTELDTSADRFIQQHQQEVEQLQQRIQSLIDERVDAGIQTNELMQRFRHVDGLLREWVRTIGNPANFFTNPPGYPENRGSQTDPPPPAYQPNIMDSVVQTSSRETIGPSVNTSAVMNPEEITQHHRRFVFNLLLQLIQQTISIPENVRDLVERLGQAFETNNWGEVRYILNEMRLRKRRRDETDGGPSQPPAQRLRVVSPVDTSSGSGSSTQPSSSGSGSPTQPSSSGSASSTHSLEGNIPHSALASLVGITRDTHGHRFGLIRSQTLAALLRQHNPNVSFTRNEVSAIYQRMKRDGRFN